MERISYATEVERAASALTLNGYVRGMLNAGQIPAYARDEVKAMTDAVSRAHGTLQDNDSETDLDAKLAAISDQITEALTC